MPPSHYKHSASLTEETEYHEATYFSAVGRIRRQSHPIFERWVGHRDAAKHISVEYRGRLAHRISSAWQLYARRNADNFFIQRIRHPHDLRRVHHHVLGRRGFYMYDHGNPRWN